MVSTAASVVDEGCVAVEGVVDEQDARRITMTEVRNIARVTKLRLEPCSPVASM